MNNRHPQPHLGPGRALAEPNRALDLRAPADDPGITPLPAHRIKRTPVLESLTNEYEAAA
jgi:putative transposase